MTITAYTHSLMDSTCTFAISTSILTSSTSTYTTCTSTLRASTITLTASTSSLKTSSNTLTASTRLSRALQALASLKMTLTVTTTRRACSRPLHGLNKLSWGLYKHFHGLYKHSPGLKITLKSKHFFQKFYV
jgi:hypothetical protein